jgi:hypothetical protein
MQEEVQVFITCAQAGAYTVSVTAVPVNNGTTATILGSPMVFAVSAGPAVPYQSYFSVNWNYPLLIGSFVMLDVRLADSWGNPITAPKGGDFTSSRLVIKSAQRHIL